MDWPATDWTGILLAGGQSKRMGCDKRHMRLHNSAGPSLMEHASQLLVNTCADLLVLVANANEPQLPLGFRAVVDLHPGQGPLPAISTGLLQVRTPYALVIPVDMPCLLSAHLQQLMQSFHKGALASKASFVLDQEQRPTFPLLLRQEFCARLAAEVATGQVRLFEGLRNAGANVMELDGQFAHQAGLSPFLNLNRPTDFKALETEFPPKRS